jgi:L-rhamnose isomerase / sugar isomerase
MILSLVNLQEAYAKALLVDREKLQEARHSGDVLGAHRTLLEAYKADVRPLCAKVREDLGASPDPVAAFQQSGYMERVREERREGAGAGWS